jgi:hypothetical protein
VPPYWPGKISTDLFTFVLVFYFRVRRSYVLFRTIISRHTQRIVRIRFFIRSSAFGSYSSWSKPVIGMVLKLIVSKPEGSSELQNNGSEDLNHDFSFLRLLNVMFSLKTDVNVPTVRNKQKKTSKEILKGTAKKGRIRIQSTHPRSVADPNWSQCGFGSSFLSQCWAGFREPNQYGSGVRSWADFKVTKSKI